MTSDLDRRRAEYRAGTARPPLAEYLRSLSGAPGVASGGHPLVADHNRALAGDDAGSAGLFLTLRSLAAGTGSLGGVLVGTAVEPAEAALRPLSSVVAAGARVVEVGPGNSILPIVSSGAVLSWLAEGAAPSAASQPVFGAVSALPKRAAGWCAVSRQLLVQSPEVAAEAVRRDLLAASAAVLTTAALTGTGVGPQPLGLLNHPDVPAFSFGGPPEQGDFLSAERALADRGLPGPFSVLASPACREAWRAVPQFPGSATALWSEADRVCGLPAFVDGALTASNRVVIGSFQFLELLTWLAELLSNPFSGALQAEVRLVLNLLCDVRIRRPEAFMVSSDAGNQ